MNYLTEKREVAEIMQRLYKRGLTTCSGGNVSLRLSDGSMLITASQSDKGNIQADKIAHISAAGENLSDDLSPSMETGMHWAIYQARPDVKAIVHAHPPKATAWACSNKTLENNLCGEARYFLGEIKKANYQLMGSDTLASDVAFALNDGKAILMQNHGALTVGNSLFNAYDRMEVLENLADLQIQVRLIGSPSVLTDEQLNAIDDFGN